MWTQHGTSYGNYSGVRSSGEESYIITLLENMCVEQREHHEEESCKHDTFKVVKEGSFRLVHEHMNAQETNFNNFATYATEQFNMIRQNMAFNHIATQTSMNNMIYYQNDNHQYYQQFYR